MPPSPDFYQNPSTEALAAAETWAKAEIAQPDFEHLSKYFELLSKYKYGCRIITPDGKKVEGSIHLHYDESGKAA